MISSALAAARSSAGTRFRHAFQTTCQASGFRQAGAAAYQSAAYSPPSGSRPFVSRPTNDAPDPRKVIIFTNYTVYKSKAAFSVKVIKPTWGRTGTGSGITVTRDGTLLFEFANARGERDYDWEKKENFALSAVECAGILESVEAGKEASFFHDPNKMSANEGQIVKTLRLSPGQNNSYFMSLSVKNQGQQARFDLPLSSAELRVVRSIIDFMIPYMLGFNELVLGPPDIQDGSSGGQFNTPGGPEPPF
ncbi:hypothetical protein ACKKBG_A12675 [Auxenochlorella protothecoides x Auxenochlorella symbiontica]|nr:hypothetical protein F751_1381 [Auxenochlorella protothecoides]KFM24116.1 hypothetical protein F751_1381 [Auxenochlorella protothecoides]